MSNIRRRERRTAAHQAGRFSTREVEKRIIKNRIALYAYPYWEGFLRNERQLTEHIKQSSAYQKAHARTLFRDEHGPYVVQALLPFVTEFGQDHCAKAAGYMLDFYFGKVDRLRAMV